MKRGLIAIMIVCTAIMIDMMISFKVAQAESVVLSNQDILLELTLKNGVTLTRLEDVQTGHNYLVREQPLFTWAICENPEVGGWDWTADGTSAAMEITDNLIAAQDNVLRLKLYNAQYALGVQVEISLQGEVMLIKLEVENGGDSKHYINLKVPSISYVSIQGDAPMAMVAQEAGWTARYNADNQLGMFPVEPSRLPNGSNAMEVAAVYNPDGEGGIFLCELNGGMEDEALDVHLYIDGYTVQGTWAAMMDAGTKRALPTVAVGIIRDDDWHAAVDYYKANGSGLAAVSDTPEWFSQAGGIFSFPAGGAGGVNQMLTLTETLQISSFLDMDKVLDTAQSYGTDVILMINYYTKAAFSVEELQSIQEAGPKTHYWNKGDYIIRKDLGGDEAFREGIRKVHEDGGRVLLYVEPYIILQYSEIGRSLGEQWAARNIDGQPDQSYTYNWTMLPAFQAWKDYLVDVCVRLVKDYDADGIYLDSLGWQWNHVQWTLAENKLYSPEEYNLGFLSLTRDIRNAIREIKPDAVVMSEAMGKALMGTVDGAWTSDFTSWAKRHTGTAITDSPLRYATGGLTLFTGGVTIEQMREMFAAGWSLSLSSGWEANRDELCTLVEMRKQYADALIVGKQGDWATCDDDKIVLYTYEGEDHTLIIACNVSDYAKQLNITLPDTLAGSVWKELLSGETAVIDSAGTINLRLESGKLAIFLRLE